MSARYLLILWLLSQPLLAALSEFKSADGSKTMRANPVAVVDGKIRFEKAEGETFVAALEAFSENDQKKLIAWKQAMLESPHQLLIQRVAKAKVLRVLFIGNSYSFQIPKVFEKVAKSEGKNIDVEQVTLGGWMLSKHAASAKTMAKINEGKWDVIVLQEQSQVPSFPETQRSGQMDPPANALASAARKVGAIPVFFLTWGRKDGDTQNAGQFANDTFIAMQKRLTEGYRRAAKQAGDACIIPVGQIWAEARKQGKDAHLYAPDGSHPMKTGNYLGACVFYSALYDAEVKKADRKVPDAAAMTKLATAARPKPLGYPLPAP